MQRFVDKIVMVTGAGSGIGQASALRLASEGASLLCVDLNQSTLDETVAAIEAKGSKVVSQLCDVSSEEEVNRSVQACIDSFGKLDVLVHMAGILRFDHCDELSLDNWQKVIDVNLTGTFLLCKAVLPHLVKTGGNIVNAASTASLSGLPWGTAYSASKGGVLAMTRTIAVEYAKRGVRANCVCPGDVRTTMAENVTFPENADFDLLTRVMSMTGAKGPEVVAGVIAMLASEDGKHITGESVRMDGGMLS